MNLLPFIKIGCSSETAQLESVVICKPAQVDITHSYKLNNIGFLDNVSHKDLYNCYDMIKAQLASNSVQIVELDTLTLEDDRLDFKDCVNRIFVRDTAAVIGKTIIFGKAALKSREKEFIIAQKSLSCIIPERNIEIINYPIEFGDLIILNNKCLIINFGLRSHKNSIDELVNIAWKQGFEKVITISIPNYFNKIHLDLMFNVINNYMCVGNASLANLQVKVLQNQGESFTDKFNNVLKKSGFDVYWIKQTVDFLYNFIAISNKKIIINKKYINYANDIFKENNIECIGLDLNKLEKAGGSARCATLPLYRH